MTFVDALTLLALVGGPLAAVQLTIWREQTRQTQEQRLRTFRTLMATRTQRLSPEHVTALNMIDVAFYGKDASVKAVVRGWHEYFENLHVPVTESVITERERLFVELLYLMARAVGYDLDRTTIRRNAYIPVAHGNLERDQAIVRAGVVDLLTGKLALPVQLLNSEPPGKAEAVEALMNATRQMLDPAADLAAKLPKTPANG